MTGPASAPTRPPAAPRRRRAAGKSRSGDRGYRRELLLLLLPYLLGSAALVALPALLSFGLAFHRYDALAPPVWAGLQNFREIFADPLLPIAVRNSLYFAALSVPLRVGCALGLALLLVRPRRGVGFYRAAVYLPTVVPEAAYALLWLWIVNPFYGPLNLALRGLGLPAPAWLVEPELARLVFVGMALFQIGELFVVLLAGLREVPDEYFESAMIAGGNALQIFYHLTLPLLRPWLTLLVFRDVIFSFQYTFTHSYLMTGGDPYYATLFLPLLIYEEAFDRFRFGPGSAMMLLMFLVTAALIGILYAALRLTGNTDED